MAELLAPYGDRLRHDAGEIRIHHPIVEAARRPFGHKVDDRDLQLAQSSLLMGGSPQAA
jgi:hypothetical protein